MRDDHTQALTDLAVVALGAVAAYWIIRTPSLRRTAWSLVKYGLVTAAPGFLWRETRRAWEESDPSRPAPAIIRA